jgi:hypothetical protein
MPEVIHHTLVPPPDGGASDCRPAGCSPSVTATVRADPDRHHVHKAVAAKQKITVLAVFKMGDASCSQQVTPNIRQRKVIGATRRNARASMRPVGCRARGFRSAEPSPPWPQARLTARKCGNSHRPASPGTGRPSDHAVPQTSSNARRFPVQRLAADGQKPRVCSLASCTPGKPRRSEQMSGVSAGRRCCTFLLYSLSGFSNFAPDLWSYGDSNP